MLLKLIKPIFATFSWRFLLPCTLRGSSSVSRTEETLKVLQGTFIYLKIKMGVAGYGCCEPLYSRFLLVCCSISVPLYSLFNKWLEVISKGFFKKWNRQPTFHQVQWRAMPVKFFIITYLCCNHGYIFIEENVVLLWCYSNNSEIKWERSVKRMKSMWKWN